MNKPKRNLGKRSSRPLRPYIAMVEGAERGVSFRLLYKRMDAARNDAIKSGGVLTDLRSGVSSRFIHSIGEWRVV